jgi:hypothetical protein
LIGYRTAGRRGDERRGDDLDILTRDDLGALEINPVDWKFVEKPPSAAPTTDSTFLNAGVAGRCATQVGDAEVLSGCY